MINESRDLVGEIPSFQITKVIIVRATELTNENICITNRGKLVLQIRVVLFLYKLGQTLLQIEAASLLKIRASAVANWGSYCKLGQALLQNRAAITNWGKMYYKSGNHTCFQK